MRRCTSCVATAALVAVLAGCTGGDAPTLPDVDPEGEEVTPPPGDEGPAPGRTPDEPTTDPGDPAAPDT